MWQQWIRPSRPKGPLRPFLVDGIPHIHAARVFEILGENAPRLCGAGQQRTLIKKAERDPDFQQLHAVNLGSRYVWPEHEVLELKARLVARYTSPRP